MVSKVFSSMKTDYFISIAIPAYKAQYLREAIQSVLNQEYKNFELIIVNDKSPEDLESIVSSFSDNRIRYYVNSENLGKQSIVLNWNKCLSYARGDFFALICDDDLMKENFISTMVELAENNPLCNVFSCGRIIVDKIESCVIGETTNLPTYDTYDTFLIETIKGNRKHTISEFFYRTQYIKEKNGYKIYPAGYYADDASILNFTMNGGIVRTNEKLIVFRKSAVNISSNSFYNVKKAKAAVMYYKWLSLLDNGKNKDMIRNRLDYDLYEYLSGACSVMDYIKILYLTPSNIWSFPRKMLYLFNEYKIRGH